MLAPELRRAEPTAPRPLGAIESRFERSPTPKLGLRAIFNTVGPAPIQADARLLAGNIEAWNAMWKTMSTSRDGIDATYFIFQRDIFGMSFLGHLFKKAREGQPVRMMVDAAGDSFGRRGFSLKLTGQDFLQELMGTGNAQIKIYHPIHRKLATNLLSGKGLFSGVANSHDKLVRSSTMAVTGGRNISKDYFTDAADRADVYRDCDIWIQGRAASTALKQAFDSEFNANLNFHVPRDFFGNLIRRDRVLLASYHLMESWLQGPPFSQTAKEALRTDPQARAQLAEQLIKDAVAQLPAEGSDTDLSWLDRRMLKKLANELAGYPELRGSGRGFGGAEGVRKGVEVKVLDRTSAAAQHCDDLGATFEALTKNAKNRILLQNPYVVLTERKIQALEEASRRGVQIDLVTNSPDSTDSLLTQAFFLEDWPKLMARIPTLRVHVFTGEQKLHAKTAVFDDRVAIVGSYNLDLISEAINSELAAGVWSGEIAADLRRSIERELANPLQKAREYTIRKDAQGRAVLKDGQPEVTFGAKDHVSRFTWLKYKAIRAGTRLIKQLPGFETLKALDHPRLGRGSTP